MKLHRQQVCHANLKLVEEFGGWQVFRQLIVTGDETWVPHFDPSTKQECPGQSKAVCSPAQPSIQIDASDFPEVCHSKPRDTDYAKAIDALKNALCQVAITLRRLHFLMMTDQFVPQC
jgi:hypothetical protein